MRIQSAPQRGSERSGATSARPRQELPRRAGSRPSGPVAGPPGGGRGPLWGFRLRHVLAVLGALALLGWFVPRVRSAWQIQDRAVALAELAVCLAGPSGLESVLKQPATFERLVRRRLVAAEPEHAPFRPCIDAAQRLGWTAAAQELLAQPAERWREAAWQPEGETVSLAQLPLDASWVTELFDDAWPLVRGDLAKLVKPSHGAYEAPPPMPLPPPGATMGLPAWRAGYRSVVAAGDGFVGSFGAGAQHTVLRSRDARSWVPESTSTAEGLGIAGRCTEGTQRAFTFQLAGGQRPPLVRAWNLATRVHEAPIGTAPAEILATACDGEIAVVVLSVSVDTPPQLWHCAFGTQCVQTALPPGWPPTSDVSLDVARVQGATVLARSAGGVVRVASSRDRGRSWTPYVVVFDASGGGLDPRQAPERLLTVGSQLLLYAPAKTGPQAALWSQDLGATWKRL